MGAFSLIVVINLLNRCDMDPLNPKRARHQPNGFPYKQLIFIGGSVSFTWVFFRFSYNNQARELFFHKNSIFLKYFYRLHDRIPMLTPLLEADLIKFKATQAQKDFYR